MMGSGAAAAMDLAVRKGPGWGRAAGSGRCKRAGGHGGVVADGLVTLVAKVSGSKKGNLLLGSEPQLFPGSREQDEALLPGCSLGFLEVGWGGARTPRGWWSHSGKAEQCPGAALVVRDGRMSPRSPQPANAPVRAQKTALGPAEQKSP